MLAPTKVICLEREREPEIYKISALPSETRDRSRATRCDGQKKLALSRRSSFIDRKYKSLGLRLSYKTSQCYY